MRSLRVIQCSAEESIKKIVIHRTEQKERDEKCYGPRSENVEVKVGGTNDVAASEAKAIPLQSLKVVSLIHSKHGYGKCFENFCEWLCILLLVLQLRKLESRDQTERWFAKCWLLILGFVRELPREGELSIGIQKSSWQCQELQGYLLMNFER